ncbi:tetratricopeptide repeat protein [Arthrobacter sp. 24S4-2]|nr:tetratricopeptide repeat protein [Arthrobacter sp. 24S4-2]
MSDGRHAYTSGRTSGPDSNYDLQGESVSSNWHPRKRRELSPWLLFFAGLFAAGTVLISRVGWPACVLGLLAIVCVVGGVVVQAAKDKAKAKDTSAGVRQQAMRTSGPEAVDAPLAKDVSLSMWGVHESLVGIPYLDRDAEAEVVEAFEEERPVLVLGDSMVGKTRMASKLVAELFPNRQVVIPDIPNGVATLMNAGEIPVESIVWLDDLERYLADPKDLKTKWIDQLQQAGNVVVATMRESFYERFQPSDDMPRTQWDTLLRFRVVRLKNDPEERKKLAAFSPIPRIRDGILKHGLGTYAGGGFLAVERLESGRVTTPIGAALVLVAIDWQRTGISEAIPEETAIKLSGLYLAEPSSPLDPEQVRSGLAWATDNSSGGSTYRLTTRASDGNLRPFDYLVDHVASSRKAIPNEVWEAAAQSDASPGRLNTAGVSANMLGRQEIAERFFVRAAEMGDPEGMANLATARERQNRIAEAETLHRRAAEAGSPHGMTGLAVILLRSGRTEEAEGLLRVAAVNGDADAMANLGFIMMRRGEEDEGRGWYRRAAAAGSGLGMTNYGMQLEGEGRQEEAEALYRAATARGNGAGMYQLSLILSRRGEDAEAERLLTRAVRHGNPAAMAVLASHMEGMGNQAEAERLSTMAADRGDAYGLALQGKRMAERGELDGAEKLLKRSAEQGFTFGIHCLGVLLARSGRMEEAKVQYRKAITDGDAQSMVNLGLLLTEEDRKEEATALYQQASDLGLPLAMFLLAEDLEDKGRQQEAEELVKKAASMKEPRSITKLGMVAAERDDYDEALRLLRQASTMGHRHAAECLKVLNDHLKAKEK